MKAHNENELFTHIIEPVEHEITDDNALDILKSVKINPLEEVSEPPICLKIKTEKEFSTIGTLGNFSLIIGKAKSKKTFLISLILATILKKSLFGRFIGSLPDDKQKVLYFDTEQSKFHLLKAVRRICRLIKIDIPLNLEAYGLRKFKPEERLMLIEKAIYNCKNLGFVVIDGVRDLVTSINDEEQATMLTSKLMKWTEELNIHIVCVLHQNKGDENARGHLGTELQNKAETVISVTKDKVNKNMSIVEAVHCRDIEFEPFAFEINDFGMPQLVEDWESTTEPKAKSIEPSNYDITFHKEVIQKIFSKQSEYNYAQLLSEIRANYALYSIYFGENKAKVFISHFVQLKLINKSANKKGNRTIYSV